MDLQEKTKHFEFSADENINCVGVFLWISKKSK